MMHGRAFPDPGSSDFSETVSVATLSDTLSPKPVTGLTATAVPAGVRLDMTLPTQNEDDSTCTDLTWLVIYYGSSTGVYTGSFIVGASSQWTDREAPEGTERYYKVVARDDAGNNSTDSEEVHAAALSSIAVDIPDDATGLVFNGDPKVGAGMLGLLFEDPDWASFIEWEIQYAVSTNSGSTFGAWTALAKTPKHCYIHKGLTTTSTYRYKYRGRPTGKDQASTTWDESDSGGTGWPSAGTWGSNNASILAENIMTEMLVAKDEVLTDHLTANCVTGVKINADEIEANHITANAITTVKINGLDVTSAKLSSDSVVYGKAAQNSIYTDELYIDNLLNMGSNDATNTAGLRESTDANDDYLSLANRRWYGYVNTQYSEINLSADAALRGYNDLDLDAQHGDLYLRAGAEAGDYIILEMTGAGASGQLQIQDWVGDGGGLGHEGYIKLYLPEGDGTWVTRYIHLEELA